MEEATGADEAPQGAFGSFLRLLALAGGWVIVALMVYTVADVILRYIFNRPFSGSIEVTEFAMSAIVFLGIAWCGWLGGHVAVDILERPLENPRLRFVPVILTLHQRRPVRGDRLAHHRRSALHQSRVSNMMRWPHYPFQFIVALGSAMYAVVLLVQSVRMLLRKSEGGSPNVAQ